MGGTAPFCGTVVGNGTLKRMKGAAMNKPKNKWWSVTKFDVGRELANPDYVQWADERIAALEAEVAKFTSTNSQIREVIADIKEVVGSWFKNNDDLTHRECDILNSIATCYKKRMNQNYEQWLADLKEYFKSKGFPCNIDAEAYRQYYDDDYSVEDAFEEDMSYE
jgi:hypothetical protein